MVLPNRRNMSASDHAALGPRRGWGSNNPGHVTDAAACKHTLRTTCRDAAGKLRALAAQAACRQHKSSVTTQPWDHAGAGEATTPGVRQVGLDATRLSTERGRYLHPRVRLLLCEPFRGSRLGTQPI